MFESKRYVTKYMYTATISLGHPFNHKQSNKYMETYYGKLGFNNYNSQINRIYLLYVFKHYVYIYKPSEEHQI